MSHAYPILRSLDPHHARIGYLGALACVATRGLDTTEALTARFEDLLFERIFPEDERFSILMEHVPKERRAELHKRQHEHAAEDPSSILSPLSSGTEWIYSSEFWLHDEQMPSTRGFLSREKASRTIDLARWTGVLLPTLELSEAGYTLQHLLDSVRHGAAQGTFNLLNPKAHRSLPLVYLRLILEAEMLVPFLLVDFVDRRAKGRPVATRGDDGLLRGGVERMLETIGEPSDPELVLALRDVLEFNDSIRGTPSTEENYLRPRLEILVDLGLVGRLRENERKKGSQFVWEVTDVTERLAEEWRRLLTPENRITEYLDQEFFGSMAKVLNGPDRHASSDEQILLWVGQAFREIGRDFGFTPGRTLSLIACLNAWLEGYVCEIEKVFDVVYRAAETEWARFLHYSGGSRFDREFLIRIDEGLVSALQNFLKGESASE